MKTYKSRILAHLLFMHSLEPAYAAKSAKWYSQVDPHELADMPELLQLACEKLPVSASAATSTPTARDTLRSMARGQIRSA